VTNLKAEKSHKIE